MEKGPALFSSAIENPADIFQVFLDEGWEINLWGKLRRATEAARADL
jgi:multidrug efflux system outer membrane protein